MHSLKRLISGMLKSLGYSEMIPMIDEAVGRREDEVQRYLADNEDLVLEVLSDAKLAARLIELIIEDDRRD